MTIDLSRFSTDFRKDYRGGRLQQGRVLTDDEFNETAIIEAEELRRTRIHSIGAVGSPDCGFLPRDLAVNANHVTFKLSAGTLYLGGHRLELHKDQAFELQTNWLNFDPVKELPTTPSASQSRKDMVWVEAWEQHVTSAEDSELLEMALGGLDTGVRTRIMHRVHVATDVAQSECASAWQAVTAGFASEGTLDAEMELATDAKLKVSFDAPALVGDLCSPPVPGGYLGAENQAIRVQMVDANTFTWGYDNASPLYRARLEADNKTLTLLTPPRDAAHWPLLHQVVEVLEWSAALPNGQLLAELSGKLSKVSTAYDPNTQQLVLSDALIGLNLNAKKRGDVTGDYVYLRVWNRGDDLESDAAIAVSPSPVHLGNTGLAVEFLGGPLRKSDFWVIAARPAAPEQLMPWTLKSGAAPHGIKRYRAPLALLEWTNSGSAISGKVLHDCRPNFLPLTQIRNCCTVTVGDGSNSFGHYTSINEAIAALPVAGGCVCVLPGSYTEAVVLDGLHNVTLHGCGPRSRIIAADNDVAIQVLNCHDITVEGLALEAGPSSVVEVRLSNFIRIENNLVQMRDQESSGFFQAVFISADDVVLENNIIEILPSDLERIFHKPGAIERCIDAHAVRGGVQLAGGCERVRVADNCITGGIGNGITLGSLIRVENGDKSEVADIPVLDLCTPCSPTDSTVPAENGGGVYYRPSADLYDIEITGNEIYRHGANGIGVVRYFDPGADTKTAAGNAASQTGLALVGVHGLSITRNRIRHCLRREIASSKTLQLFAGYGGIALALTSKLSILENDIANNGRDWSMPVCGIFALLVNGLRIERNRILNNGPRDDSKPVGAAQMGVRAGIHIWFAFASPDGIQDAKFAAKDVASAQVSGQSALASSAQLRIDGNQVVQPLGRALFLLGAGPISVTNNYLASRGAASGVTDALAATAVVVNLGISKEWTVGLIAVLVLKLMGQVDSAMLCAYAQWAVFTALPAIPLPTGKLLFTDNQLSFQMPDGKVFMFSSCLLLSLDDVGANDNQFEFHGGASIVLADLLALAATLRTNDNRMAESWQKALYSGLTLGLMNTATANQSTHCIRALGLQTMTSGNLVLAEMFCPDACHANRWR